jgi:hypothetical protein
MQETLGIFFIALSAVLLIGVGLYALAPALLPRRTIVARQAVLGSAGKREDLLKAVSPAIDKGMVEELFAELYSVRTAIAELAAKTRTDGEQTEAVTPPAATLGPEDRDWYAVDQGAIDEMFAELFSIRSAVANLTGELRSLREQFEAAEATRRRPTRKAA